MSGSIEVNELFPSAPLGVLMRGSSPKKEKDPYEFHPTPAEATWALLNAWRPQSKLVWEPACGNGDMSRVLEAAGLAVLSTDILQRDYAGQAQTLDYLAATRALAPAMITNPPFSKAIAFAQKAVDLGIEEFALFTKIEFWTVGKNVSFFVKHPPVHVMPIVGRIDFSGEGNPVMNFQWTIWRRGNRDWPTTWPIAQANGPIFDKLSEGGE